MALKKGYCLKCSTKSEKNRIFLVNSEAEHCYCPRCMARLDPKEAIADYEVYLANKILVAQRLLYQVTDFYGAYCKFAEILDIEPDSYSARLGRIVSLIYMSKLRKSKFREAAVLLKSEANAYFHKMKDLDPYVKVLRKCFRAIDEYDQLFRKRLTIKNYFFSVECLKLFVQRLVEMIELKTILIEELGFINSRLESEKVARFIVEYKDSLKLSQKQLHSKYSVVDGTKYEVAKINDNGEVILGFADGKSKPITHYRKYTLNETDISGHLINDYVYPNNVGISRAIRKTLPVTTDAGIISIVLLALYFILIKKIYAIYLLIAFIIFFLIGLTMVILDLLWRHKLKIRRHLID